jgi:hypothetical protein
MNGDKILVDCSGNFVFLTLLSNLYMLVFLQKNLWGSQSFTFPLGLKNQFFIGAYDLTDTYIIK